jgi:hypothetical protein
MKAFYVFGTLIFFLTGCQNLEEIPDLGLDYQPLEEGLTWTYQVQERIVFGENDSEQQNYFFRDSVSHRYLAENGTPVYLITRMKSADRQAWNLESQISMQIENQKLLRRANNEIMVPLVFPPGEHRTWDGNIFNVLPNDPFSIKYKMNYQVGQLNFTRALMVVQDDFDDELTLRDNRFEVYAQNVGMVESYYEVMTYCSRTDCLGEQRIDSGRLTHIKLLSYEKN